jgi:hypothetical protein
MKKTALLLALAILLPCMLRAAETLEQQFQNPPDETKPWCYWYWFKSDITQEGITKDLEAMKKAGISLAMIGNIEGGGPVKMFSPEWKAATRHAMAEAGRLGIDLYMFNSPGWSQSGGPWIKPEQSMRRVIWNEIPASGGPFSAKVRNAPQDIAVLAVPRRKFEAIPGKIDPAQPKIMRFESSAPFTARAIRLTPTAKDWAIDKCQNVVVRVEGQLYALDDAGTRTPIAKIRAIASNPFVDLLPLADSTYSFGDITAKVFEFEGTPLQGLADLTLESEPLVAAAVEKQLARVHPDYKPNWESYIFPDTREPVDSSVFLRRSEVLNLTGKLDGNGTLTCELPPGDWTILYFGMVTTGKKNHPAPPEGKGLECDKMSKEHIRSHFHGMFDDLLAEMTPEERKVLKGVTIDSYEVGPQNWTDGFDKTFAEHNGYDPIPMLPVLTGRVIESAKDSDAFLSDLRRTVATLIAENYVGGLREIAHEHGLRIWCENYGHWGFVSDFLSYGGQADQVGGEFWVQTKISTECRAASSAAHIHGKQRVFAEAFTSGLDFKHHPYLIKKRGDRALCDGINHFVLHVVMHQPRDATPGVNSWFGTAFHRNTPWFAHSRNWVRSLQRCHLMLQQGEPAADTAVYIGDFAPQMIGPRNPVPAGYDYDYINSEALLERLRVENGEFVVSDENDPSRISTRYKMVAMPTQPAAQAMRPQVRARIEELKKQGGVFVDGVPVSVQTMLSLSIAPLASKESQPLLWKARRLEDGMLFFLSNFAKPGPFEVTLRVSGKAPELFNPVTGEVRKIARFWPDGDGTCVAFNVNDPADSFFLVFREKVPEGGSVVNAERDGQPASPAELDLSFDKEGALVGEATRPGNYMVTMSTGAQKKATITASAEPLLIKDGWAAVPGKEAPNTLTQEVVFDLPEPLANAEAVKLDLGKVNVMATVTLNGKEFDTLWMPPFELDVTQALQPGQNRLRLQVVSTSPTTPSFGPEVRLIPFLRARFQ